MQVVKRKVRSSSVQVLRDTGCSRIMVKEELLKEDQYLGMFSDMLFIDNGAEGANG